MVRITTKEPIVRDAIYSREEAASMLGISLSTLKRLIAAGTLRASSIPGTRRVLIRGSSILDMLDEHEHIPSEETTN